MGAFLTWAPLLLDALSFVLVLALVALGLVVIFGLMGVINLAHGELFMLGGYTVVLAVGWGVPFWLAVVLAPIAVGAVGWLVEVLLIRRLAARPLDTILATWGLAIVLQQAAVLAFGPGSRSVARPTDATVTFAGISYPAYRLELMAIAALVLVATMALFARTHVGLRARAAIADPDMAAALGVNVRRVRAQSFVLGAALAGLAGALVAPIISVDPHMGFGFLVPAFLSILVGGGVSLGGVLGGAAIIGGADSLLGHWMSPVVSQIVVFLIAIVAIRLRAARAAGS